MIGTSITSQIQTKTCLFIQLHQLVCNIALVIQNEYLMRGHCGFLFHYLRPFFVFLSVDGFGFDLLLDLDLDFDFDASTDVFDLLLAVAFDFGSLAVSLRAPKRFDEAPLTLFLLTHL